MDIQEEIRKEQALPDNQQSSPDFLRMTKAFDVLRQRLNEAQIGKKGQLDAKEISDIVKEVIFEKGAPPNPFLKPDKDGDMIDIEDANSSFMEFLNYCTATRNPDPNIKAESNLNAFNYMDYLKSTQGKEFEQGETSTNDAMFKRMEKSGAEMRKDNPKQYFEMVVDILKNKDKQAFPDPSKYHWACEQMKYANKVEWRIIESKGEHREEVSFRVTFPHMEPIIVKSMDFKRQINEQQASALERREVAKLYADRSQSDPDKNADVIENIAEQEETEVSIDSSVGKKEQLKPKAPVQQKADEAELEDSDIKKIKKNLGYYNEEGNPKQEYVRQWVDASENDKWSEVIKIVEHYRDMPDLHKEKTVEDKGEGL